MLARIEKKQNWHHKYLFGCCAHYDMVDLLLQKIPAAFIVELLPRMFEPERVAYAKISGSIQGVFKVKSKLSHEVAVLNSPIMKAV